MTRTEQVVLSSLLSDLPDVSAAIAQAALPQAGERLPVDVDFADTMRFKLTEDLNDWAWRVLGRPA